MEVSCETIMNLSVAVGFLFGIFIILFFYVLLDLEKKTIRRRDNRIIRGIVTEMKKRRRE